MATVALLATIAGAWLAPSAASADMSIRPVSVQAAVADSADSCGGEAVRTEASRAQVINLVIDDSGSMFVSGGEMIDRWSQAKYALEVFAALLGEQDTLNVYRLSDGAGGPAVTLDGAQPDSERVGLIHAMQMQGNETPYGPVQRAYEDLAQSDRMDRWLVILSDGEFDDRETAAVQSDIRAWAQPNRDDGVSLRVAFLAIGAKAPKIANEPQRGIIFDYAAKSADLLDGMTGFANTIFQRNIIPISGGKIFADIDLRDVLVFAQGKSVSVGAIRGSDVAPESSVTVRWTENQTISRRKLVPVPNQDLHGVLARFGALSAGTSVFEIEGAKTVTVFYKPDVGFGVQLTDEDGQRVDADKITGGRYQVKYGFMDAECQFIESSPLLGDVQYSAEVLRDGTQAVDSFQSGDSLDLGRGAVELNVAAEYLGGNTAEATIRLDVLQAARPTGFDASVPEFRASELDTSAPPDRAVALTYGLGASGALSAFTAEEWASVRPDSFTVTTDGNLDFEVALGDEPGRVYLTPKAPNGDVYAADTGDIPVHLAVAHTYDEQLYSAETDVTVTVIDDISWWDRFVRWFGQTGWWLLLLALLALLILGYLLKPRFAKKVKRSPTISGVPIAISQGRETGNAKFRVDGVRKVLPFVADTAVLTYVPPGVPGFRPMKLKAGRGGKIQLTNWRQIAERKNVALNGSDVGEDTKRMPLMSPSTQITATVPQKVRYEVYLNV